MVPGDYQLSQAFLILLIIAFFVVPLLAIWLLYTRFRTTALILTVLGNISIVILVTGTAVRSNTYLLLIGLLAIWCFILVIPMGIIRIREDARASQADTAELLRAIGRTLMKER